jgi:glycosyltransferase involved in cell wall biosynthesis
MNKLSVILNTYNEAENIIPTIKKLLDNNYISEIVIVDDNSTDNTANIIYNFKNDKIKLFIRKNTKGFASAFIYGIIMSHGDYILRFDVDMHSEIDFFIKNFDKIEDNDLIIFSRYVQNGSDQRGNYRKIPSLIINKICQYLLSSKIKDYTSCIMLFRRDVLQDIFPLNTQYANFIIEFVFNFILKNKKFVEIGYEQKKNTELNSKSAPNIIRYLINGFLYLITIFKCTILRIVK